MASVEIKSTLNLHMDLTLKISLEEARMLEDLVGYGAKSFLEGYYKHLGKSYMQKHEKAVYSFFDSVKKDLAYKLYNADEIIKAVNKLKLNP